jgi:hypothetical protein
LQTFIAGLKDRRFLHQAMGDRVAALTSAHFYTRSTTHANPFGAPSSRFWAKAGDKVTAQSSLRADDQAAVLTIQHPGVRRAFEDVAITPSAGKQWLTIPLIAAAYNRRAYRVKGLFRPLKKGASAIGYRMKGNRRVPVFDAADRMHVLAQRAGGTLVHWYALVRSVLQKQDRSILPSDEEFQAAALRGAVDYMDQLRVRMRERGGGIA